MAHHPLVVDLIRLVGRLFYRDEYCVVLDALAREHALRDDGMEAYFGLPHRQIRKILNDLREERLVCYEEITERRAKKRDEDFDWEAAGKALLEGGGDRTKTAAAAAAAANRTNRKGAGSDSDDDSEDDDDEEEDEEGGSAGAGAGGRVKRRREKRKISTTLWYINPRYFTDVIRYRLHLMKRMLERLEGYAGGSEHMFRCGNRYCSFECTLLEAQQRRTAEMMLAARTGAIGSVSTPLFVGAQQQNKQQPASNSSTANSYFSGFTCPLCGTVLTARHTENVATAAAKLLVRMNHQLRFSGLPELLRKLENVVLGANRPSDLIKEKKMSLHGPAKKGAGGDGNSSGAGAGAKGSATGTWVGGSGTTVSGRPLPGTAAAARLFTASAKADFDVEVEGDDGAAHGHHGAGSGKRLEDGHVSKAAAAALAKAGAPSITPAANVAAASLPDHLRISSITGEASKTLGFVHIQDAIHAHVSASAGSVHDDSSSADVDIDMGYERHLTGAIGSSSDSAYVYDTNINADQDAAMAAAAAADGGGGALAGDDDGGVSNEELWKLLFDQAQQEEAAAAMAGDGGGGGGGDEWEDVDGNHQAAAAGAAVFTSEPAVGGVESGAAGDDDDWEDA